MKKDTYHNIPIIDITVDSSKKDVFSESKNLDSKNKSHILNNILENYTINSSKLISDMSLFKNNSIFIVAHDVKLVTPMHSHDFIELLYVIKGSILNTVDNSTIHMMSGDICIHNKQAKHSIVSLQEGSIIANIILLDSVLYTGTLSSFMQSNNVISDFLNNRLLHNNFIYYTAGYSQKIQNILFKLFNEFYESNFCTSFSLEAYLLLLLNELIKLKTYSFYGVYSKISKIINYIQDNCCNKNLEEIAKDLNYTANYLTRLVKKSTGKKCSDIMIEIRLNQAIKYLRESDLAVDEIADKVGYSSPSHFFNIFKSRIGMTPLQYKRLLK